MNPAQKKAFLARMAAGRRNAGTSASSRKVRSYHVHNESSGQDLGVYRGASGSAAIKAMLRQAGHHGPASPNLRATLVRPAGKHAGEYAAGRVVGRKVKRKRAGAAGAGMVHAGALPARKGHPRGKIGGGSHSVRMTRIETAVVDLARANHAIVSKVVDHEKRLNRVESTLSTWAKGRR